MNAIVEPGAVLGYKRQKAGEMEASHMGYQHGVAWAGEDEARHEPEDEAAPSDMTRLTSAQSWPPDHPMSHFDIGGSHCTDIDVTSQSYDLTTSDIEVDLSEMEGLPQTVGGEGDSDEGELEVPESISRPEVRKIDDKDKDMETLEQEIFTPYTCPKLPFKYSVKHCGDVVETASLAAVQPPDVTYQCLIPDVVIRGGRLSDLQVEAVVYAGQRHTQFNMDGTRGGFMLGDGTGVGKGRTCAGIIYDYFLHERVNRQSMNPASTGRPIICVWVSVSWDLAQDARRDLSAITEPLEPDTGDDCCHEGEAVLPVVTLKEVQAASFSLDAYARSGVVIFATYSVFSRTTTPLIWW